MKNTLDLLREIQGEQDERMGNFMPEIANSEDPKIAAYRLKLGLRKPTQKILLSQIFGTPEKSDETPVSQLFRIKREQV